MNRKAKYPTYNGQPWDELRKREFDTWKTFFHESILFTLKGGDKTIDAKLLKSICWNMAAAVVLAPSSGNTHVLRPKDRFELRELERKHTT